MKNAATQELRTCAIGAIASVLLYASGFLVLFTPLPLLYVFLNKGRRAGVLSSVIAVAVVVLLYLILLPALGAKAAEDGAMILMFPGVGFVERMSMVKVQFFGSAYYLFFCSIAFMLSEGARRNWSVTRWVGTTIGVGMGAIIIMALAAQMATGASLLAGIQDYVQKAVAEFTELNRSTGSQSFQARYLMQHGGEIAKAITSLMPSLIFVFVLLAVVLNMLVSRRLAKVPHTLRRLRETVTFRLPDQFVWLVIAGGAAFFADYYLFHGSTLRTVAVNVLVAMGAIYFFQGFAVVVFFLGRLRSRFIRLLVYLSIIIFFHTAALMLAGIGLADVWVHFRERFFTHPPRHA
jgi:hypothetical protein